MKSNLSNTVLAVVLLVALNINGQVEVTVLSASHGAYREAGKTFKWPAHSTQTKNKKAKLFDKVDPWNQFRGPNGSGVVETTGLPDRFGVDANLAWKVGVATGYSSPVLTRRYIFVTGQEGEQLLTLCFDRSSGAQLWKRAARRQRTEHRNSLNDPAAPSPVTDGENVYVFFAEYGLISYNSRAEQRWQILLGPFNSMHGMGTSPILVNDSLILQCDHDSGSYLMAVEKDSGRIKWRRARPGIQSGYSTPAVWMDKSSVSQLLVTGTFEIAGYSLEKGERLWRAGGLAFQAKGVPVIGSEMVYYNNVGFEAGPLPKLETFIEALAKYDRDNDGKLSAPEFVSHRMSRSFRSIDSDRNGLLTKDEWQFLLDAAVAENALLAIRPGGKGDLGRSNIQWTYSKSLPDVPAPVLYQGVLYIVRNGGILTALDPNTGTVLKQGRLPGASGSYYASPVAADGKLFLLGQEGKLTSVKAAREWEVLAVSDLGEDCMATPAIGNGRLYVRTRQSLMCFGEVK